MDVGVRDWIKVNWSIDPIGLPLAVASSCAANRVRFSLARPFGSIRRASEKRIHQFTKASGEGRTTESRQDIHRMTCSAVLDPGLRI